MNRSTRNTVVQKPSCCLLFSFLISCSNTTKHFHRLCSFSTSSFLYHRHKYPTGINSSKPTSFLFPFSHRLHYSSFSTSSSPSSLSRASTMTESNAVSDPPPSAAAAAAAVAVAASTHQLSKFSSRAQHNRQWVDTARIHHALLSNHFVDMLDLYGAEHGHEKDVKPSYSSRMRSLSCEFRRQALGILVSTLMKESSTGNPGSDDVENCCPKILPHFISEDGHVSTSRLHEAYESTLLALKSKVPLIINPILIYDLGRIFARPPALIRVDIANRLLNLDLPFNNNEDEYVFLAVKRKAIQTERDSCKIKRGGMDRLQPEMALWHELVKTCDDQIMANKILVPHVAVLGLSSARKQPVACGVIQDDDAKSSSSCPYNENVWRAARMEVSGAISRGVNALNWRICVTDDGAKWLRIAEKTRRAPSDDDVDNIVNDVKSINIHDNSITPTNTLNKKENEKGLIKGEVDDVNEGKTEDSKQQQQPSSQSTHNNNNDEYNQAPFKDALTILARVARRHEHRPNMKVTDMYDWPWANAKREIARNVHELTLVSGVSNMICDEALRLCYEDEEENGTKKYVLVNDYCDERVTASALGIDRPYTKRCLEMCKSSYKGANVQPKILPHNRGNWRLLKDYRQNMGGVLDVDDQDNMNFDREGARINGWEEQCFYVDFELASPDALFSIPASEDIVQNELNENEKKIHETVDLIPSKCAYFEQEEGNEIVGIHTGRRQDPLIFMIGCGRIVNGKWKYHCFSAKTLSLKHEQEIIHEWMTFMRSCTERFEQDKSGYVFVWGPEQQLLKKAVGRITDTKLRTEIRNIIPIYMVNMLQTVMSGDVCVRGCTSHSIKSVSQALMDLGLVNDPIGVNSSSGSSHVTSTKPSNDIISGMDVMAIALNAVEQIERIKREEQDNEQGRDLKLMDVNGMKQVKEYNEADCLDIARITNYLRDNN